MKFRPKTQLFIGCATVWKILSKKYPKKASESHRCTALNYKITESSYA